MSDVHWAIDPGTLQSGVVRFVIERKTLGGIRIVGFDILENGVVCELMRQPERDNGVLAIEAIINYGNAMPASALETCIAIGRFLECWGDDNWTYALRSPVKAHLCGSMRARDPAVRQALIDRFGGKDVAVGSMKCPECNGKGWRGRGRPVCEPCAATGWLHPPGPLRGITSHCWAALAVACYFADTGIIRQRLVETK